MGKTVLRTVLAVWIIIWVLFLIRPLFKKGMIGDYRGLLGLTSEGKRAYVTGPTLYEFIMDCKRSIPEPSSYGVAGIEKDSLEHRRVRYYLYPDVEKKDPDFLLVYGMKDYDRKGYEIFKVMGPDRYILGRVK
jgi:hypothetical protein